LGYLNLEKPLNYFKGWNPTGEAHVTTITPVEYFWILKNYVDMKKINQIANELKIQNSDLTVLGLGRGQTLIDGKIEETYFVIVHSENLLKIRRSIYQEYLKAGGNPANWNPENFYPHITIGFTKRDLHEKDGVLKDVEHSLDNRFELVIH
jgi:2'-5' RNA ligase